MTNKLAVVRELTPIKRNMSVVAGEAEKLVIRKADDMKTATEILSTLNKYADSIRDKKETITKPLNTALKNARAMFKPLEDMYEEAIGGLRTKMGTWQTEQVRIQREEAAKIAARVAPGKGNLSLEKAVEKIEALDKPADNIATEIGDVKFREVKQLKIVEVSLIPREYLVPDEKKILNDLKAGKAVAGCEVEIIQTAVNYR